MINNILNGYNGRKLSCINLNKAAFHITLNTSNEPNYSRKIK